MIGIDEVTINGQNMQERFGVLVQHSEIDAPKVQSKYLTIPFRTGDIDLTEYLTGSVEYSNRTVKIKLKYIGDYFKDIYSDILNFIHGQQADIIFKSDEDYMYIGRLTDSKPNEFTGGGTIELTFNCEPYKQSTTSGYEWLWDPFDFEEGYINEFNNLQVSGTLDVVIIADIKSKPLVVTTDVPMRFTYQDENIDVDVGKHTLYFTNPFTQGENTVTITGTGTVSIEYRGGRV